MKQGILLLMALLLCASSHAVIESNLIDDFGPGSSSCSGSSYDCGSFTDAITAQGGTLNATITLDDGQGTYFCLTQLNGSDAYTKSCIIRQGFNNTLCDVIIAGNTSLNKSEWYNSTGTDLTGYGWNGGHAIPLLGTPTPTRTFQIDTSILTSRVYVMIEYVCNETPKRIIQSPNINILVSDNKGILCSGNSYYSVAYNASGTAFGLSGLQMCINPSFCDTRNLANYTMAENMTANVCTPGCNDNTKNGEETDVDYGGTVCGNCSTNGKNSDEFYVFAKGIQQERTGVLTNENQFNSTAYCEQGKDTGASVITVLSLIAIIAIVTILFILFVLILVSFLPVLGIIARLRRKKQK